MKYRKEKVRKYPPKKENSPMHCETKIIKHLGISLPKEKKYLYVEKIRMMKEIGDDTNRWTDIPCSWIGRINIVKMIQLPKTIDEFKGIPITMPMLFFTELGQQHQQQNHNLYGKTKETE